MQHPTSKKIPINKGQMAALWCLKESHIKNPKHFPLFSFHTHFSQTQNSNTHYNHSNLNSTLPEPIMFGPSQPASDTPNSTIKFFCSYGGKILPRYPDGKLRYLGGHTRVLSVDRSVPFSGQFSLSLSISLTLFNFSFGVWNCFLKIVITVIVFVTELLSKLEELCASSVTHLRCQLPAEDLDALVSITSDEDLANLIEEYDRTSLPQLPLKIKVFISPPRFSNKVSTPPLLSLSKSASSSISSSSSVSSTSSSSSYSSLTGGGSGQMYTTAPPVFYRCVHHMSPRTENHGNDERSSGRNIPLQRNGNSYHAQGNTGENYLIHNGNHWQ